MSAGADEILIEEPDGLIGPQLARELGISSQTVLNYADDGMPVVGTRRGGNGREINVYDLATCREWIKQNKGTPNKGGKREGAGRKHKTGPQTGRGGYELTAGAVELGQKRKRAEKLLDELAAVPDHEKRISIENGLLNMSMSELRLISVLEPEVTGLTKAATDRLHNLVAIRRKMLDMRRDEGGLIEVRDTELEWTRRLASLRAALEGLAPRAGAALVDAGVPASMRPVVQDVIRELIEDLIAELHEAAVKELAAA